MKVEVVPHDPKWRTAFEAESKRIASALGGNVINIHHIGSTAIPNIYAKPVIDIMVEVNNIIKVDQKNTLMEAFGNEVMGEYGIPGRRYFRRENSQGIRTHHVHTFEVGTANVERHLAFRDYMIAHPEDAQKYSELKRKLAEQYSEDIYKYMEGKDEFVKKIERRAIQWSALQR